MQYMFADILKVNEEEYVLMMETYFLFRFSKRIVDGILTGKENGHDHNDNITFISCNKPLKK